MVKSPKDGGAVEPRCRIGVTKILTAAADGGLPNLRSGFLVGEGRDHGFGGADELGARPLGADALAADARALEQQRQRIGQQFGLRRCRPPRRGRRGGRDGPILHSSMSRRAGWSASVSSTAALARCSLARRRGRSRRPAAPRRAAGPRVARMTAPRAPPQRLGVGGHRLQALDDQVVLRAEMPVERHLVGAGRLGDGLDPDAADAVLVEQVARGRHDPVARLVLRRRRSRPHAVARGRRTRPELPMFSRPWPLTLMLPIGNVRLVTDR